MKREKSRCWTPQFIGHQGTSNESAICSPIFFVQPTRPSNLRPQPRFTTRPKARKSQLSRSNFGKSLKIKYATLMHQKHRFHKAALNFVLLSARSVCSRGMQIQIKSLFSNYCIKQDLFRSGIRARLSISLIQAGQRQSTILSVVKINRSLFSLTWIRSNWKL
jgi:hypothetical protein